MVLIATGSPPAAASDYSGGTWVQDGAQSNSYNAGTIQVDIEATYHAPADWPAGLSMTFTWNVVLTGPDGDSFQTSEVFNVGAGSQASLHFEHIFGSAEDPLASGDYTVSYTLDGVATSGDDTYESSYSGSGAPITLP